jgi:RNA polymerase sigma factor (sigma-70 family)
MPEIADFADFLRRIRAGDDTAAVELVERFEPLIRRVVRRRIADDRLNRAFDSLDVSQSVLAKFFSRASTGEYELTQPEQLTRLLVTMARNRLNSRARRERCQVRDVRRLAANPGVLDGIADARPSPCEIVSRSEQLERVKSSLTEEERAIFELRSIGLSWDEVATQLGGSEQARRMQLSRAVERLERQLSTAE